MCDKRVVENVSKNLSMIVGAVIKKTVSREFEIKEVDEHQITIVLILRR